MSILEYLRALRRRWQVVALSVMIGLALGWITSQAPSDRAVVTSYTATSIAVVNGSSEGPGTNNLQTLAALTMTGELPRRVAIALDFEGDPQVLANKIETIVTNKTGIMRITATSSNGDEAANIANSFVMELNKFLDERKERSTAGRAKSLSDRMEQLKGEIRALDEAIAVSKNNSEDDILRAERDAKVRLYGLLYENYQQLALGVAPPSGASLLVIQEATPRAVSTDSTLGLQNQTLQLALALALGLAVGVSLALVVDRFDSRIRTKSGAEQAFGLPVLAQIPLSQRGQHSLVVGAEGSVAANSYRLLAAGVGQGSVRNGEGTTAHLFPENPLRSLLVTSAGPTEGKTTVVANLALAFAELGKKVLIISCDFKRPMIHRLFGLDNNAGLSDALKSANVRLLEGHIFPTAFKDVALIPSGAPAARSGELLSSHMMTRVLREAQGEADIVLLDSPPILVSDTAHLLQEVDGVLLVARAGKTTVQLAQRATELIEQFHAPVLGVVLTGAEDFSLPVGYYEPVRRRIKEANRNGRVAKGSSASKKDKEPETPPPSSVKVLSSASLQSGPETAQPGSKEHPTESPPGHTLRPTETDATQEDDEDPNPPDMRPFPRGGVAD